jgi:hypothetical protein
VVDNSAEGLSAFTRLTEPGFSFSRSRAVGQCLGILPFGMELQYMKYTSGVK